MSGMLSRSSLSVCRSSLGRKSVAFIQVARASTATATAPAAEAPKEPAAEPRKRSIPLATGFEDLLISNIQTKPAQKPAPTGENNDPGNNERQDQTRGFQRAYRPPQRGHQRLGRVDFTALGDDEFDGMLTNGLASRLAAQRKEAGHALQGMSQLGTQVPTRPEGAPEPPRQERQQRRADFARRQAERVRMDQGQRVEGGAEGEARIEGAVKRETQGQAERQSDRDGRLARAASVLATQTAGIAPRRRGGRETGDRQQERWTDRPRGDAGRATSARDRRPDTRPRSGQRPQSASYARNSSRRPTRRDSADGRSGARKALIQPEYQTRNRRWLVDTEPTVMSAEELGTLFASSTKTALASMPQLSNLSGVTTAGEASEEPTTLQKAQIHHALEEIGGVYSRYHPTKLHPATHVTPAKAGPLVYAHLAMARRPDISLARRKHALEIVAKASERQETAPAHAQA